MSRCLVHRCHYRGQEPPAPGHDPIGLVASSYRRAYEAAGLRTVAGEFGRWWLPPEARRSQCLGSMWLIDGWLTDRVPNGADGFAL